MLRWGGLGVDLLRRGVELALRQRRPGQQGAVQRRVDVVALFAARRFQYVIHDFVAVAGMADADAQAPVVLGTEVGRDVLEAVVAAQTAAELLLVWQDKLMNF